MQNTRKGFSIDRAQKFANLIKERCKELMDGNLDLQIVLPFGEMDEYENIVFQVRTTKVGMRKCYSVP